MRYRCVQCGNNTAPMPGANCESCWRRELRVFMGIEPDPAVLNNPWADMPLLRLPMPVFVNPDPPVRPAYSNGGWM